MINIRFILNHLLCTTISNCHVYAICCLSIHPAAWIIELQLSNFCCNRWMQYSTSIILKIQFNSDLFWIKPTLNFYQQWRECHLENFVAHQRELAPCLYHCCAVSISMQSLQQLYIEVLGHRTRDHLILQCWHLAWTRVLG